MSTAEMTGRVGHRGEIRTVNPPDKILYPGYMIRGEQEYAAMSPEQKINFMAECCAYTQAKLESRTDIETMMHEFAAINLQRRIDISQGKSNPRSERIQLAWSRYREAFRERGYALSS